jgi:hypothetical protein
MLAVYNSTTNQVVTFIRDDHGGYVPPAGYTLVESLPPEWTWERPDLETLRQAKRDALAAWWANHEAAGIQPTGYGFRLGISADDVALLNGVFTLAQTAVALEQKTIADTFPVIDKTGNSQLLTLPELTLMLLTYGEARAILSATYSAYQAAINAAQTTEDLDAVEIA